MAQLNDFIGQIKGEGLMHSNRFAVQFDLPRSLKAGNAGGVDMRKILLFCDQVTIPGVTISTTPAFTYGEAREMPYEKLFAPATFSFFVDNSMHVKKVFDKWQGVIINPQTRITGYYREYITDITITIYDIYSNTRYQVKLHEAYLKDIGQLQMDYANKDLMKLPITIQFKYWTASDANASVKHPDNRGFFEKLFDDFFGDSFQVPDSYFNDFGGFQSSFQNYTPELGGLSLPGASFAT
jgi:hypothetical protein